MAATVRPTGLLIVLLYVVSIPWYREPGTVPAVVLGLPDWVVVALACYLGIALLTARAWLGRDIEDRDDER